MKQAITLSFLLLVNMIILAHVIIPHHHNKVPVALTSLHHEHSGNAMYKHHHQDTVPVEHDGNHHGQDVVEDYLLQHVFSRLGNNKQTCRSLDFNFDLLYCIVSLFSEYSIPQITDNDGLPFREKPYLLSFHTEYISVSLGLRAPPIC